MSLIGTRSTKLNESGQAVIEYMLVLVITVILVGTFAYQFSSAFKKYANNYFGDYIMCLLESGELPGQVGECRELMSPFDFKNGTTSTGGQSGTGGVGSGAGGSGSGSGSTGGSGSGKSGKSGSGKNGSSSDSSSKSSSSASKGGPNTGELGSNTSGSDSGSSSGRKRSSTSVKGGAGDDAAAGASKAGRPGLKAIASSSGNDSSSSSSEGRGRRRSLDRGFGYAGQEEQKVREEERPATKAVAKDEGEGGRPKKVAMSAARKPAEAAPDSEGGFTFGKFMKFILIAGIVIAILVLFGGQLLAISKGGEK